MLNITNGCIFLSKPWCFPERNIVFFFCVNQTKDPCCQRGGNGKELTIKTIQRFHLRVQEARNVNPKKPQLINTFLGTLLWHIPIKKRGFGQSKPVPLFLEALPLTCFTPGATCLIKNRRSQFRLWTPENSGKVWVFVWRASLRLLLDSFRIVLLDLQGLYIKKKYLFLEDLEQSRVLGFTVPQTMETDVSSTPLARPPIRLTGLASCRKTATK